MPLPEIVRAFQCVALLAIVTPAMVQADRTPRWLIGSHIPVSIGRPLGPSSDVELVLRAMKSWNDGGEGRFVLERTADASKAKVRIMFVGPGGNYGEASRLI